MKKRIWATLLICALAVLAACGSSTGSSSGNEKDEGKEDAGTLSVEYKESDEYFEYAEDAVTVTMSGDSATVSGEGVTVCDKEITITASGTYVLRGDYTGTVIVEADKKDKVFVFLDGVEIKAVSGPAFYEKSADKVVFLLPEDSENHLEDAKEYKMNEEKMPTAAVFCKDSLTVTGNGKLTVKGNHKDAITSKGKIKIMSGEIVIDAADDGIVAKKLVAIKGGNIYIGSQGDAIKTTSDKSDKGNVIFDGGKTVLDAGKDGIQAEGTIVFCSAEVGITCEKKAVKAIGSVYAEDGTVNVLRCKEGFEAGGITVNGGTINILSTDDGFNATAKNEAEGAENADSFICINGGSISINAGGDGFDSNGSIVINGGHIIISSSEKGDNNATDFQKEFLVNGGIIAAAGTSQMYQTISEGSKCLCINFISDAMIDADTKVVLSDNSGEILSFNVMKKADAVLIAGDKLDEGTDYVLTVGGKTYNVKAEEGSEYSENFDRHGFGGRDFGGANPFDKDKKDFDEDDGDKKFDRPEDVSHGEFPGRDGDMPPEKPDLPSNEKIDN